VADAQVTAQRLDLFLRWLSPDPERAGVRYNEIHSVLRKSFAYRGCTEPQYWADVTFDRVIRKIETVAPGYEGDPVAFLRGVARRVFMEYNRSRARREPLLSVDRPVPQPSRDADEKERRLVCLEQCLAELAPEEREIILLYYQGDRGDKIERRRQLASDASLSRDALRKRSQRIRARVKQQLLARLRDESLGH
jgi:RNA polymerase sigma factor (sigma-70 family)